MYVSGAELGRSKLAGTQGCDMSCRGQAQHHGGVNKHLDLSLTPVHKAKAHVETRLCPSCLHVYYVLSAIVKKFIVILPILFLQISKTNSPSFGLFAEKSDSVQLKLFAVSLVKLGKQFQPYFPTLEKMSEVKAVTSAFFHIKCLGFVLKRGSMIRLN